ncbi:UBP-type zinc finger domain-containing protein [Agromyces seonyuensis]|uniref:UBP-type domain-containing protein n=1 Tax=Agromyces seonyuensis TaxID=2662446 RepID=A0A6I4NST8_9MICO|nr:UBP-type zinc finger domain-containing protein [Agromyces seonyuensis]MWB97498.1 hypothetical protein [Agromyces seonyuensis]
MEQIDPAIAPSGTGCVECDADGGWWLHLRRCTACGHIGCCDSSPRKHARAHSAETGHRVIRTFEPGEDWFWDYVAEDYVDGAPLAPPEHRPDEETVPGPSGRVPDDWKDILRALKAAG